MPKWIILAIIFGPITTLLVFVFKRWYFSPEKVKARSLKRIRASQRQFCDW